MSAQSISAAFTTKYIDLTRDFYQTYFNAKVTFDCGWYINLEFCHEKVSLQFMSPKSVDQRVHNGTGLMFNIEVNDVDYEYDRLMRSGLRAVIPLEDHPWGDRGFAIRDPNNITLYLYSLRKPAMSHQSTLEYKTFCPGIRAVFS